MVKMENKKISQEISRIFKESRNNYGTRKIKKELSRLPQPKQVSRRRIGRLMSELGLVSNYTVAQYKPHKSSCAEAMFKVFKTELANSSHFCSLEQLAIELDDYVHWFNNIRIH